MITLRHSLAAAAVAIWVAPALAQSGADTRLAARTSDAGGVRVVVRPTRIAAGADWLFEVTMDTHTKPLTADLTKTAVLLDDRQQRYAPTQWKGDPPGGHHRKGVLHFPAPEGKPKSFEVHIESVGGPDKRVFRWKTD